MAISIPAFPAIPSQTQQPADPYNNALKLASLKNMMSEQNLRQQLAPLDVQEAQSRAQLAQGQVKMQQLQLQSEQGMLEMYSDPEFRKAVTGSDAAQTNGLGFDPNAIFELASKHNVLLPQALQVTNDLVARSQKIAETQKAIAQTGEAETKIYEAGLKQLTSKIGPILDAPVSKAPDMLADFKKQLISNPPKGIPQQDLALLYAADLEHLPAIATRIGLEQDLYAFHKEQAGAAEAKQKVIPESGGLSPAAKQDVTKDILEKTNPAVIAAETQKAVSVEVAKQMALAPDLQQIVNSTRSGRAYINREDIPKESVGIVEKKAAAAGVPVVDKDVASTLSEIDTAKANQQTMLNLISKKLPQSPGERIYKGPENKLEAAMQTDPDLAAMGTFRNAAIQSMRAVAGSKGLRINQYEVQMAIDNDIPKMTDTWAVAQAKAQNLQKFLDNAEQNHLVRNRTVTPNAEPAKNERPPLSSFNH